jgi:hypothetical protein
MQSRWFDFGGDTIIRVDKYEIVLLVSQLVVWLTRNVQDIYGLRLIDHHKKGGSFLGCH